MLSSNGSDRASPTRCALKRDALLLSRWRKFSLIVKVVELRLRFIVLMTATALVFAYWDDLWNRYDKWMRPAGRQHARAAGARVLLPHASAGRAR